MPVTSRAQGAPHEYTIESEVMTSPRTPRRVALAAGFTALALGIIGEYLARMHFRTMDKPAYAVRESVGLAE